MEGILLAVDIGQSGGFCYNGYIFPGIRLLEMPMTLEVQFGYFDEIHPNKVIAENVHTFKGQGIKSSATLMRQRGQLEGICASVGITPEFIEPGTWIQCFTMKVARNFSTKKRWKEHLRDIAVKYTGIEEISLKTADAVLIWIYAAHKEIGLPLTRMKIWN